jgi:hypothetical protein
MLLETIATMRSNVSASLAPHPFTPSHDALAEGSMTDRAIAVTPLEAHREIEGRAAWLIWQVEAGQVSARDAQEQLGEMEADLARFGDLLPADLRGQLTRLIGGAQSAAMIDDLAAVRRSCGQARTALEKHRSAVFA